MQARFELTVALVALAASLSGPAAAARPGSCPEPIGEWSDGPTRAVNVVVSGDCVLIGGDRSLWIADVSDPATPETLSQIAFPESVVDVVVSQDYAYVALGNGLSIIDISDATRPQAVGFFAVHLPALWDGSLGGGAVGVVGSTVYVAGYRPSTWEPRFFVVDVSDPAVPGEIGSVELPQQAFDLEVDGEHVFVGVGTYDHHGGDGDIVVIDVSDPTAPEIATTIAATEGLPMNQDAAVKLAVSGDFLYVLTVGWAQNGTFQIFDIGDLENPQRLGYFSGDPDIVDIGLAVAGDTAYVGGYVFDQGICIRVIDVIDPTAPQAVALLELPDWVRDIDVVEGLAYVAIWDFGLRIVDVSTPTSPVAVGAVEAATHSEVIAAESGFAYAGTHRGYGAYDELRIVDFRNPSAPVAVADVQIAYADCCDEPLDVDISNGHLYALTGHPSSLVEYNMVVIDVRDPTAPVVVAHIEDPGPFEVADGFAYVTGEDELRVFDVSDPSTPVELGRVAVEGTLVAPAGDLVFVASVEGPLAYVVDVSAPIAPVVVGDMVLPTDPRGMTASGDHAYIVGVDPGDGMRLTVVDATDPRHPRPVGSAHYASWSIDREVDIVEARGFVYIPSLNHGLSIVDVRVPHNPIALASDGTFGPAFDVALSGGTLLVAQGESGVTAYRACGFFDGPVDVPPVPVE